MKKQRINKAIQEEYKMTEKGQIKEVEEMLKKTQQISEKLDGVADMSRAPSPDIELVKKVKEEPEQLPQQPINPVLPKPGVPGTSQQITQLKKDLAGMESELSYYDNLKKGVSQKQDQITETERLEKKQLVQAIQNEKVRLMKTQLVTAQPYFDCPKCGSKIPILHSTDDQIKFSMTVLLEGYCKNPKCAKEIEFNENGLLQPLLVYHSMAMTKSKYKMITRGYS